MGRDIIYVHIECKKNSKIIIENIFLPSSKSEIVIFVDFRWNTKGIYAALLSRSW